MKTNKYGLGLGPGDSLLGRQRPFGSRLEILQSGELGPSKDLSTPKQQKQKAAQNGGATSPFSSVEKCPI